MPPTPAIPVIVLDANVLIPASLRDLLLRCVEHELFRLQISEQIWTEVVRNLGTVGRMSAEQVSRLDVAVQTFFGLYECLVAGYEPLIPILHNHPRDRHVLAVAVHAHAQRIVIFNLKDFPPNALAPYNIAAEHPDCFLTDLLDGHVDDMKQIVQEQAAALVKPPLSERDVLAALSQHVPAFAVRIGTVLQSESA
jgi:predicted nucleic acid-binding protein